MQKFKPCGFDFFCFSGLKKAKLFTPSESKQSFDPFALQTVPGRGLEPLRLTAHAPQTCLSTSSNTRAGLFCGAKVENYHDLCTFSGKFCIFATRFIAAVYTK
jgi:hypothetical protein